MNPNMRKSESIIKLEELGLNTLPYFITTNKAEVMHYLAKHADEKMSLRTERGDEFECPFYYMIPGQDLLPMALQHLSEGYKLILAPSLDVKGCLGFGVVAFGEEKEDRIEFVEGEGKVREVYTHPKMQSIVVPRGSLMATTQKKHPKSVIMLNYIYSHLKKIVYDETPCCVEWSYYDRNVGAKKDQLIVWEIRPYV